MKKTSTVLLVSSLLASQAPVMAQEAASSNLSLEDILSLNVGSLLGGSNEEAPATIYTYTSKDLKSSTARDLSQFIQLRVPGSDTRENVWNNHSWGFRGIMTDRAENVLLNVNGEMQNLRSRDGIVGESWLGLFDDIAQVDVVVGPGSVIHGPGAIAGVINLELKDGRREKGDGAVEVKSNLGIKGDGSHSRSVQASRILRWDGDNSVVRMSAGYVDEQAAKGDWGGYSPVNLHPSNHKFDGKEFTNYRLTTVYTNEAQKLRAWFRFYNATTYPHQISTSAVDWDGTSATNAGKYSNRGYFQKNLSVSVDKKFDIGAKSDLKLTAGYTTAQYGILMDVDGGLITDTGVTANKGDYIDSIKETRARFRTDFTNKSWDFMPWALGAEIRKDFMGKGLFGEFSERGESLGAASVSRRKPFVAKNYTNLALFGESQLLFSQNFKGVLGARYDNHTVKDTVAPRVAAVYTDKVNTGRIVWQKAFKTGSADAVETNRFSSTDSGTTKYASDPSKNDSIEAGYKYAQGAYEIGTNLYTNNLTLYTWNDTLKTTQSRNFRDYGTEINVGFKGEDVKVQASHSHVMLKDAKRSIEVVTVDGKHLMNFMPDITRVSASTNIKGWETTFTGAYLWGLKDRKKIYENTKNSSNTTQINNGSSVTQTAKNSSWIYKDAFKLNVNMESKVGPGKLGFDFKNLLALVDRKHALDQKLYTDTNYTSMNSAYMDDLFSVKAYYTYEF